MIGRLNHIAGAVEECRRPGDLFDAPLANKSNHAARKLHFVGHNDHGHELAERLAGSNATSPRRHQTARETLNNLSFDAVLRGGSGFPFRAPGVSILGLLWLPSIAAKRYQRGTMVWD